MRDAVAPSNGINRACAVPATVEAELADGLGRLSARVGWDCRERQAVATYQLERLEELAAPAHVRFLMWLVVQVRFVCPLMGAGEGRVVSDSVWHVSAVRPLTMHSQGERRVIPTGTL